MVTSNGRERKGVTQVSWYRKDRGSTKRKDEGRKSFNEKGQDLEVQPKAVKCSSVIKY